MAHPMMNFNTSMAVADIVLFHLSTITHKGYNPFIKWGPHEKLNSILDSKHSTYKNDDFADGAWHCLHHRDFTVKFEVK